MSAVRLGKVEAARSLLEAGADADVRDAEGRAACHFAGAEGRREALEMLAAAGAELDVPDRAGRLLLHIAVGSPGDGSGFHDLEVDAVYTCSCGPEGVNRCEPNSWQIPGCGECSPIADRANPRPDG